MLMTAALPSSASAYDGPVFRQGLWQFERSVERRGIPTMPHVGVLRASVVTRCVDPTVSMLETFRPTSVGTCRSEPPTRNGNVYIFRLRCDHIGPVQTTIEARGSGAYRETHVLSVGMAPRTETIEARRIGDCGPQVASNPPTHSAETEQDFESRALADLDEFGATTRAASQ